MKLPKTFWLLVFALGGGWLWALQFGREPRLGLPWLALVPTYALIVGFDLRPRQSALWGWLTGTVLWAISIPWIAPTLEIFGKLPGWLSWGLFGLLAAYFGLYHSVFCGFGRWFYLRNPHLSWLAWPSLWVILEIIRGWMIGGFPWNLAGYAVIDFPGVRTLAAWTGPWGMSVIVVLVNGVLAVSLWEKRWKLALTVVPVFLVLGWVHWGKNPKSEIPNGPRIHVIQPNTANMVEFDPQEAWDNYDRLLRLSHEACDREKALILWPESATWPFRFPQTPHLKEALEGLANRGCPVLFNTPFEDGDRFFNSVFLLDNDRLDRYDKRHLVPFGEYVPMGDWFPFVLRLAREAGQFEASEEVRLIPYQTTQIGTAICFEVTFPAEVADLVQEGATVLVSVTNDAWYGDSWAPWQHLRSARFRAAETRRPLVRAAITGVSASISSEGEILDRLGVFEEGWLTTTLEPSEEMTFFSRFPRLVPRTCYLLFFGVVVLNLRKNSSNPS